MVCGGYIDMWRVYWYVTGILVGGGYIGMWWVYWYVAVILVCGGFIGMWRLYQTTALLELLWAAKNWIPKKKRSTVQGNRVYTKM